MKITAWRIVQARHVASAFTGEGAKTYPGRWNHRGVPMIYTAGSLSLAAIEMVAHLNSAEILDRYRSIPVSFDERLCRRIALADLPEDWNDYPALVSTRDLGTAWQRGGSSVVLAVPSALIPIEAIFLINPEHPNFRKMEIGRVMEFRFDPRLLKKV